MDNSLGVRVGVGAEVVGVAVCGGELVGCGVVAAGG